MYEVDWFCFVLRVGWSTSSGREEGALCELIPDPGLEMSSRVRGPIRMTRLVDRPSVKGENPSQRLVQAERRVTKLHLIVYHDVDPIDAHSP